MKVIIFDFDGTIADSFKLIVEIAHKLTGHQSLTNPEEIKRLKNESMVEVTKQLDVPKYMLPILLLRGRRMMSKRLNEVKPFKGMDEVLSDLHKHGYRLFVMSTNSRENIASFLTVNELKPYISKVYGGIGLLSKSGALRKILKQNKLQPSNVIYVGDEVRDIEAAQNVDIPIVAVSWGFNDATRLLEEKPMAVVYSRSELLKVLKSWEND